MLLSHDSYSQLNVLGLLGRDKRLVNLDLDSRMSLYLDSIWSRRSSRTSSRHAARCYFSFFRFRRYLYTRPGGHFMSSPRGDPAAIYLHLRSCSLFFDDHTSVQQNLTLTHEFRAKASRKNAHLADTERARALLSLIPLRKQVPPAGDPSRNGPPPKKPHTNLCSCCALWGAKAYVYDAAAALPGLARSALRGCGSAQTSSFSYTVSCF